MILYANADCASARIWAGNLRVATKTEIYITSDEHFLIHRSVRLMTRTAAFPQRLVNKNKRSRLVTMALRTRLILPGKGETTRRFENIHAVWIVTANAV